MKMYNAAVEVARRDVDAHNHADELIDALAGFHVAVGTSSRGWLELRISLPAGSLTQATTTALAVIEKATGADAIACEIMTEEEFAAREGFTVEPDIVNSLEAATMLGVSATRVRQLAADGRLQEVPVGGDQAGRIKVFTRSSVEALANQDRRGGRPRKVAEPSQQKV